MPTEAGLPLTPIGVSGMGDVRKAREEARMIGVPVLKRRGRPWLVLLVIGLAVLWATVVFGSGAAQAYTNINLWIAETASTQAGGHPDIGIHAAYDTRVINNGGEPPGDPCNACQDPRDIVTHLPTGFIGSPSQIPQCSLADFATEKCSTDTQVGLFMLYLPSLFEGKAYDGHPDPEGLFTPVYNLPPHPYEAAQLGFVAPIVKFAGQISLNARTESDYGLDAASYNIFHLIPVPGIDIYLWGVPASPIHDKARIPVPVPPICAGIPTDQTTGVGFFGPCHGPIPSSAPQTPFLSNPTSCGEALTSTLDVFYYDNSLLHADSPWPATTGCDQLSFNPSLSSLSTTEEADSPAGIEAQLKVPQSLNPTVPSPSEIKATRVTLPPGFTINSNAADGKSACTDAQSAIGTRDEAKCPETAKIGTVELDTAALPGPIDGGIYLGAQLSENRYQIFLTADGFATHVKLAGVATPDPQTGQVRIAFEDLPQAPFQLFTLHFFGAERGPLATPTQCGKYAVEAEFVPWDSMLPNQFSTSFITINSGPNGRPCPNGPRPFEPAVKAGVVDNTAGVHSSFGFKLTRIDGDQNVVGNTINTPPGFLASLRGIPYCSDAVLAKLNGSSYSGLAERASSACPPASRIGSVTVGSGAGSRPLYTPGQVYLAGPYKGAPLSLAIVVPAVSGPYDLGNVMVRTAVYVDPVDTSVTAITDPLPQILEGIPLRLRTVTVNLDRPDFTINPTNCDPFSVDTGVTGDEAAGASLQSHFQVANCANLGFGPKLGLKLLGGLKVRGHPAIQARVRDLAGNANIRSVQVTLPTVVLLDNSHLGTVCTRVDFAREACPEKSYLGTAEAVSPLLDQPLRGPVFLRSSSHKLPDIVMDLKGQIEVELAGRVDAVDGALRTTFDSVPDAPVSSFALNLSGGSKGLLINSENLCTGPKRAEVRMIGQNGKRQVSRVKLGTNCGSSSSRNKRRHDSPRRGH